MSSTEVVGRCFALQPAWFAIENGAKFVETKRSVQLTNEREAVKLDMANQQESLELDMVSCSRAYRLFCNMVWHSLCTIRIELIGLAESTSGYIALVP